VSYTTITQSVADKALQERVIAAAMKEAYAGGEEFSGSAFAAQLRPNSAMALNYFMWPTGIDYEVEYAYAVGEANPNPGGDPGVISDLNIQAVVQKYWPPDPVPAPQLPDQSLGEG
jgi:hypothetical protein